MMSLAYAAAAETPAREPLSVTIDVAAILGTIVWLIVILIILHLLREALPHLRARLPTFLRELAGRVTKVGFGGFTLEFAKAKAFAPAFSSPTAAVDLRQRAGVMQVTDSNTAKFLDQLRDPAPADYAIVNLGTGDQWLTSRLYIMAIILGRMKGLKAFVFLGQSSSSRRYLGWTDPNRVRWALGRRYPWLEAAYAAAYSHVAAHPDVRITPPSGRLVNDRLPLNDPRPSLDLLQAFLQAIQHPSKQMVPGFTPKVDPPAPAATDWVKVDEEDDISEHAAWLTSALLEDILGDDLDFSHVAFDALQGKSRSEQIRLVLGQTVRYVAVTREELRFQYLIDRSILLEQMANAVTAADEA
jgi:hypothetical protein